MSEREQEEVRQEAHLERLETRSPHCGFCPEATPAALTGKHPGIVCYECQAKRKGQKGVEQHHFAGRKNHALTMEVGGNDHRVLSDYQKNWPHDTLTNPDESPLIKASAALRGFLDYLRLLIERGLGWIAPFLEWLDAQLETLLGEGYWKAWNMTGVPIP